MQAKLINLLKPTIVSVSMTVILFSLSLFIFVSSVPTSKVTWDQYHGAPLSVVQTNRYSGPCLNETPCARLTLGEINPFALFIDLAFWYLVSSLASIPFSRSKIDNRIQIKSL
jgi:hypothetical protein